MTDNSNTKDKFKSRTASEFKKELKDFALVVGEECPEGHRRDPSSGACLPITGMDHTKFTTSLNDDQGPEWRGEVDKTNDTFDNEEDIADRAETAMDAEVMDERNSCAQGTTFSFVQNKCVTLEEAEAENNDAFAMNEEGEYVEDADHVDVVALDPEGRKDTINFQCPPNQFFDHKLRECVPLNKDTVMASENFSEEFKQAVATFARIAKTSSDTTDGHRHVATLSAEGDGVTSAAGLGDRIHSHVVKNFVVKDFVTEEYTSRHPGVIVPEEHHLEEMEENFGSEQREVAEPLDTSQRKSLPSSAFGVPGKRKFPLDTCNRVKNAMARFNQAKGLTASEKSTLRRKILARAKSCGIQVDNFAKAETEKDFQAVVLEMLPINERVTKIYSVDMDKKQGPCPPGMVWNPVTKKCEKSRGFIESILEESNHPEIVSKDPEGRRDPVGFRCPPDQLFDFKLRKCIPLNKDTVLASETDATNRDLSPLPEGKPARLSQDCPEGTIWDADLRKCKPLDSRKKISSSDEEAALPDFIQKMIDKKKGKRGKKEEKSQTPASGPGKEKDDHGCAPFQVWNPETEKCESRKGSFKGKSEKENAENAMPDNREGLTDEVPGKVKLPSDCPPGTIWDGTRRTCTPLDTREKNRPSGSSGPQPPTDVASESQIESLSLNRVISHLDEIIREEVKAGRKEKGKVAAKDLPNEAFPPSLVNSSRRALMHHLPEVADAYDTETVDVVRLRNALARVSSVQGFAKQAVEDACEHLLFHAREILKSRLGKI